MNLKRILKGILSQKELDLLVRGYDVVGDIAIIIIPADLSSKEKLIAAAVLQTNSRIKVVVKRLGNYGGEYRTLCYDVIGGEDRKETCHKEYGILLQLHLEKVYYSTRSSAERVRIASLVDKGEDVLVMFSGIGAFPLSLAKHSPAGEITGVEKNPVAHYYAQKNLELNKKSSAICLHEGDVMEILPQLDKAYDRILMPLPRSVDLYLGLALGHLREKGWLHYYLFQEVGDDSTSIQRFEELCGKYGRKVLKAQVTRCGHVSPRRDRICVDAQIDG